MLLVAMLEKLQKQVCRTAGPVIVASLETSAHYHYITSLTFFKKLGFNPCKAVQPLRGMELQEKTNKQKDKKDLGKLFRTSPKKKVSINSRLETVCIMSKESILQAILQSLAAGRKTLLTETLL